MAGDRLRIDDFVAVFAEDAIFEIDPAAGEEGVRNVGRDVIRNWFLRWGQGAKEANPVHRERSFAIIFLPASSNSRDPRRRRRAPIGRPIRTSARTTADIISTSSAGAASDG